MQTGMKAGLAIVLAVFLTGIVGFLTAVTPEDEERTYYDQVSDLTPIVDYSSIESYSDYNSITNVSGWSDKDGVTIHFLENGGFSAYPFRYYTGTTTGPTFTGTYNVAGMFGLQNYSAASSVPWKWYPTATVYSIPSETSSVTISGLDIERISAGHITIENSPGNGVNPPRTPTFMINLQHLDGDKNIVHQFTYIYYGRTTEGETQSDRTISSLSAFDSTPSERIVVRASGNGTDIFGVSLEIDVSLPSGHEIVGYISPISTLDSGQKWIYLPDGTITSSYNSTSPIANTFYNGGIDWYYNPEDYSPSLVNNLRLEMDNNLNINGTAVNVSIDMWKYMPISQLIYATNPDQTFKEGDTLTIPHHTFYTGSINHSAEFVSSSTLVSKSTWNVNFTTYSTERISYHANDGKWYPSILSENGQYYIPDLTKEGHPLNTIYVVEQGLAPTVSGKLTGVTYAYKYVDPNKFVEIASGVSANWRNYMDRTDGGTGEVTTAYYNNGMVELLTEPGTTISSQWAYFSNTDGVTTHGSMTLTVPTSIPYAMARVVLDFQNNTYYAQGIVWGPIDEDERGTSNWTARPYEYPIYPTFTGLSEVSYVQGLTFEKEGGTKVFILNTRVQTDPMGRLWGDPSIYLGYYFPDYFEYDSTTGNTGVPTTAIRMLINGVVSYGTSLTINGQYMPVADGNITFTYYTYETETIPSTDPNVPPTETIVTVTNEGNMPVKGMAIDWEDGHVYLVFTEQGKTRYDLGEYNTTAANVTLAGTDTGKDTVVADIISGTGTWYWQSNLYTINNVIETTLHLDLSQGLSGWGMTLQVSMLLFAAMLIVGVAIVHYYYRDSDEPMGVIDWVIIGAAILLSLGVATI